MSTFKRVAQWNKLCGKTAPTKGTAEYYKALANQAERIKEELEELQLAITFADTITALMTEGDCGCDSSTQITIEGKTCFVEQESLDHWNEEIADALCDLDVVVAGGAFLSGHDHESAINAVLENNDVKYTTDHSFARESLEALGADTHHIVTVELRDGNLKTSYPTHYSSVHRNSDDKICKLLNHPKVNLTEFLK
jgi:hypothetical protein